MKFEINWFDIPAQDFSRAVKFYQNVFGVQFDIFDCETEKMACFADGESNIRGAVYTAKEYKPTTDGISISINVGSDMTETLEKIVDNGGKIIKTKTKIEVEGLGYFSLVMDSEGNRLSIYSDN